MRVLQMVLFFEARFTSGPLILFELYRRGIAEAIDAALG